MAASDPESSRIAAVRTTPLFAGLASAEAQQLAATMSEYSAAAGEVVFLEGRSTPLALFDPPMLDEQIMELCAGTG